MPLIKLTTKIKADRQIVFDLSRSIDLHKISTAHTNEEAIKGRTTGLIQLGESVTWRARHFGVYQTLTSRITEFKSPEFFVDVMVKGIFKSFRHEHHFQTIDQCTLMTDQFEYHSPLGFLGSLADKLFLKKYMIQLLKRRNHTIKEFAESGRWKDLF